MPDGPPSFPFDVLDCLILVAVVPNFDFSLGGITLFDGVTRDIQRTNHNNRGFYPGFVAGLKDFKTGRATIEKFKGV